MFNCAKAECLRFPGAALERATRKGGGGGTSCSSYISFLSFLIKGDEWQP